MSDIDISRREVLASIGAGVGALTVGTGTAGADGSGRHIVGTSTQAATDAAKRQADSVHRVLDFGSIGQAVAGQFSDDALDNLRKNPNVRYIEVDGQMHAIGQTLPWGIDRVDADIAHTKDSSQDGDSQPETGGDSGGDGGDGDDDPAGADIAIIDTGIDSDHPDLQANIGTGKAFVSCKGGPKDCRYAWDDDEGHGTHCAGIADAIDNNEGVVGVSTEATLHAVKVLDNTGSGTFSDVASGIRWTADQGYDVGSMSLGASSGSQTVKDACQYAVDNGVLLVAAAGNSGPCTDCVGYPAAYSTVIAVSAIDQDDTLAGYSSTGPEVELAAPGTDIYSTYAGGGYETLSGTSMACPHVSGAGGQLMDNGFSNSKARTQLQDTAEDLAGDGSTRNNKFGYGLLDVEAALGLGGLSVDSLSVTEVETSDGDAEFDVSWEVSDPDGDLSSLTLTLQDTTAGSQDDSATSSVSGSSASGTTRLVASGDEASGHSYEVTATVEDSAGNTASKTTTTLETEATPTIDSLSLTEVETSDSDAEFDADWQVSDTDGDLDKLDLTLYELDSSGNRVETEDSAGLSVSGDSASGTTRLVATGDDGSGNSYEVEATVSDTDGTTSSATATATEGEDTPNPTVKSLSLSENNQGGSPHAEFDASWSVSDDEGDLDTLDLTLTDLDDRETEDSTTVDISGSSASGTTELSAKHEENSGHEYEVEAVVTDSNGNTDSATATEVEDGS